MSNFTLALLIGGGLAAWLILGFIAAAHAVMYKRDPRSATIWAVIGLAIPLLGPCLYWAMGINRVERRALEHLGRRGRRLDAPRLVPSTDDESLLRDAVGHLVSLRTVADRVTRMPLLPGNRVVPMHTGEQAYPRMLDAIASAERSVTLASYIFDWDDVGRDFASALGAAAQRGVNVHVLVDGIGALRSFSRMGRKLIKSGAKLAAFYPLRFPFGRLRINLRNHRKILVVDGRVGFTGGMNISQRYLVQRESSNRVEDLHFEITGPVVAEMQHTFAEDWETAAGAQLTGHAYFPELASDGPAVCRGISSGPDEDFETFHWILQAALAAAQHSVHIATPYFVPTSPLISAMAMRALRGVDIKLILPSRVDQRYMRWAADAYLWQLLEHGVRVYRRPPPFVHSKLMIVDRRWILLGSANLDRRSFRLHFEFDLEVYDPQLAGELATWLDELIATSAPVTLAEMDARPGWQRLRDGLAKIVSPHL